MFGVVFASEYLRRVTSKAFLLVTFLTPVILVGSIGIVVFFVMDSEPDAAPPQQRSIAVLDAGGEVLPALREAEQGAGRFVAAEEALADAKQAVAEGRYRALLVVPARIADGEADEALQVYVREDQPLKNWPGLRRQVRDAVRSVRLERYELPAEVYAIVDERVDVDVVELPGTEAPKPRSNFAAIGTAMFMAFGFLFLAGVYGGTVMQAVMEEKSSRMAEIVLSSVAPFQLLAGKVLGVAAVAATQLAIWLALASLAGIVGMAAGLFDPLLSAASASDASLGNEAAGNLAGGLGAVNGTAGLGAIRYDVVLTAICLFPLGYLINAAMFAAVGALYESPLEAQMSTTLAMLPSLLAVFVAQTTAAAPDSPLVVFAAFFPFTAPAIMPAWMLLADVALWQTLLSISLCLTTTIAMFWVCGRIFRGSLLNYGQKPTLRGLRRLILGG